MLSSERVLTPSTTILLSHLSPHLTLNMISLLLLDANPASVNSPSTKCAEANPGPGNRLAPWACPWLLSSSRKLFLAGH